MPKIKGWKKIKEYMPLSRGYTITYVNTLANLPKGWKYTVTIFKGNKNLREPYTDDKKWYVVIRAKGVPGYSKWNTKEDAMKKAINWMKHHPSG